jgi:hypothetical protein
MWLEPTTAISIVARAQDLTPVITAAPYGRLELGDVCDVISTVDAIVVLHCPSDSGGCTSYGAFYGCDAYFVTTCYDYQHSSCASDDIGIIGNTWCCPEAYPNCVTLAQSGGMEHFECYDWLSGSYEALEPTDVDVFQTISGAVQTSVEWSVSAATVTQTVATTQTVEPEGGSGRSNSTPTGAIVGGTIGGVALLGFLAVAFLFMRSRKRKDAAATDGTTPGTDAATPSVAQLPTSYTGSPMPAVPRASYPGGPPVAPYYNQDPYVYNQPQVDDPNKAMQMGYPQTPMEHQPQQHPQQYREAPGS